MAFLYGLVEGLHLKGIDFSISPCPASGSSRGASFAVTDTVVNSGGIAAGASTTRHYLSADQRKDGNDRLFTGTRAVPALGAGGASTGTVTVWIPSNTALGPYVLLAGADDTIGVSVVNETNNCVASVTRITVTE